MTQALIIPAPSSPSPPPLPARRTMFDIGRDLLTLDQLLDERGGDISHPDVEAAVVALFADLTSEEAKKLDGWAGWWKQLDMETTAACAEKEQWAAREASRKRTLAWLKERLKAHIEGTNRKEALTASGRKFAVQANGGKVPVVYAETIDMAAVPEEFKRTRVVEELDREAVETVLKDGWELGFARLGERGAHLRLR